MASFNQQINWVETRRGKQSPVHQGYHFKIKERKSNRSYWICKGLNGNKCSARLVTEGTAFFSSHGNHDHEPDKKTTVRKALIKKIKSCSSDVTLSQRNIYQKARTEVINEIQGAGNLMPTIESVRICIRKETTKNLPPEPMLRQHIELEGPWKKTNDNRNFLIANDGTDSKIIIFGTGQFLSNACKEDAVIFGDGTFKACPKQFKQIYTLHCEMSGKMFVIIYALLPDQTEVTYSRMLSLIDAHAWEYCGKRFKPKTVMIDFEVAMISAIRNFNQDIEIKGCLFHFGQCLWRRIQFHKLGQLYNEDQHFKINFNRIKSLAFLDPSEFAEAVPILLEELLILENDDVNQLIMYLELNWLNHDARFPWSMWNHASNESARTTNAVEGWHNRLNRDIRVAHPRLSQFITSVKNFQTEDERDLTTLTLSQACHYKKKKFRDLDEKIQRAKEKYRNREIDRNTFLDSIGHLMSSN